MKKLITTMLIAITIFTLCSGIGAADEHIIYPSGSIQEAVNIAASGDIIIVKPGTYSGSITIDTVNLTIRSESGNPEDTVIQANNKDTPLFSVNANNTTISGFKVTAGGKTGVTGIRLYRCSNCTITDNRADSNTDDGIRLYISTWNTIYNNTADLNHHGIVLEGNCSNNNLTSNHVNSNTNYGFYLTAFSSNNSLNNNTAQNNSFGFYLINSSMNLLSGNDVSNNTAYGMWITHSNNNTISGNTANETSHGISLDSSDGNIVFGNIVSLNNVSGLYMCRGSDHNTVFNNYLNNTHNADISNYNNTWNTTKTAGKNIIGGPSIAGNFWAKPDGTGFSESAIDSDLDGIADSQYADTNFIDYLPLVLMPTPELPVTPVASFTANNTSGTAPLDVQFNDTSTNIPTFWEWQFGDGTENSTEQNLIHRFTSAGTYTVNLTATNVAGSSVSASATITVNEPVVAPVASFTADKISGTAPLDVQFNDTSTNSPTEWLWQFGDGTANSTVQNPIHTFANAGTYTVNVTATNTAGSSVSESATITVLAKPAPVLPVANFSSNVSSGYAPLSVQFNDSSKNTTKWNWDFDDGSNSTSPNPVHVFSDSGTYTVNLTVSNGNGTNSTFGTITVLAPPDPVLPVANFSSNVSSGYAPLDVQFNDSSENATSWNWDFGDGNSSTEQNPLHTYSSAGSYPVNLTAMNVNGTNSSFGTITVLATPDPVPPVANFSSNVSEGYSPLDVQFNDSSENATRWYWDFGDGSNSTEENPLHTYSSAGDYTVNLTASNDNDTSSKSATIIVLEAPDPIFPVANFSSNVSSGYAPLYVQFTDSSENATAWNWDFGDSTNSTESNPLHTYSSAGTYTVNLTAINGNGTSFKVSSITVFEEPDPILPVANFSSNVSSGYAPLDVQLNDRSENATKWNWDFGDGSNSTEQNPLHTYSSAGDYTVNLTASNVNGTNSTFGTITVSVKPELVLPVANFSSNVSEGYAPLDVQFNDTSTNSPTSWEWQFGDGTANSTEQNPVHTFAEAGAYAVNVTATNTAGSSVSASETITVNEPVVTPVASFTADKISGTAPLDVQFNDTSTNSPTEWLWQFGDETANSTEQNPVHTFANAGTYTVNVTATNTAGSSVSASETITVNEPVVTPVASFTADKISGTAPLDVQFNDTSTNSPTSWEWQFGDGTANSTEQNPVHTFAEAGAYTVNVTATNTAGSSVSASETITVNEPVVAPVASFTADKISGTAPLDVQFNDTSTNSPTEWLWQFGDGTANSTEQNPVHTFANAGTYTVNVTATNTAGSSVSASATITVLEAPVPPDPIFPVANFSSNVSSGYAPLSIQFTDSSKNATGWNWDFNDGSSSTDQNPMHTYSKSGTYAVNLTARNINGTSSRSATITVLATPAPVLPVANFSSNTTEGYAPLSVQFNDSSKNATEWYWDFENDSIVDSTEQNTSHTYSSAGTYTVNLTAKNANGTNSISGTITVLVKPELVLPVANFSSNVSEGYIPLDVQFNDSSENATSWNWDFGDSYNSTERNPMHTYSSAGTYTVNLTAGNVNGTNSKLSTITVLVKPELVLPVADFSTSVTGGYAPLSVTFTDLSQNATSRSWDVNGDGIEDSNASSFVYEYASAGTYTAKLTAINANGTNEKTATIIVDRKSNGGSSSGSSGGGGGGGSPEPAKNVEVKELSQVFITNGNHVKFNFPKNVTAVVYLSFDARKTAGKTTTIVEMLKNQSTLTPDAPQGEVYSYLNIWVGNGGYANEKNIENSTVCFRVKKSWIEDKDINWSSIILNRYSDRKWNELPTTLLREDDRYLYFVSETPGFSPFAITAEKTVIEMVPETESPEQKENIELDIEMESEQAEDTGVSQKENLSKPGSGMIYFIIGLLGVLLLGGFLYRRDKLN